MVALVCIVENEDIPKIMNDYFERFSEQPESAAELVKFGDQEYCRLRNVNGVLAVYDAREQYVSRESEPKLYAA
jgi:hypothetical protein